MALWKRLRKSLLKRFARIAHPDGYFIAREGGLRWLLDHRNYVDRQLGVFGGFEREQMRFLFSTLGQRADAFLDIGANFGLYALTAAKNGVADTVLAFEPDPRNAAQLSGNLYLNALTQEVQVYQAAVSDLAGSILLALHSANSTGKTRVAEAGQDGAAVPSLTLDGLLGWEDKLVLVKIDIEGHELHALRGMARTLQANTCVLQIECFDQSEAATVDFMASLGYRRFHRIDFDHYFCPEDWSPAV
ncbi:MAG: FkbM family methyltransferase [Caulobacter sp.]|nr:FkbM family methyltransferase [Caulobacter sp.]